MKPPHQPALVEDVGTQSPERIDTGAAFRALQSINAFAHWPTSRPETTRTPAPACYKSSSATSTPFPVIQLENGLAEDSGTHVTPSADGPPSLPVGFAEYDALTPVDTGLSMTTLTQFHSSPAPATCCFAENAMDRLEVAEPAAPVQAIASDRPADEQSGSILLNLPPEILDIILAMDFIEADHLAMSGVCQLLRKMYSKTVLCAIGSQYGLNHITNQSAKVILGSIATRYLNNADLGANQVVAQPVRNNNQWAFWQQDSIRAATPEDLRANLSAIQGSYLSRPISKSTGKSMYKVTEKEIMTVKPHRTDMMGGGWTQHTFYTHAALRRLAYRVHGGPLGHQDRLDKLAKTAAKAKAKRQRNIALMRGSVTDAAVAGLVTALEDVTV